MEEMDQNEPAPRRRAGALGSGAGILAATLPILACFLGGATQKWCEGVVVALLGLILLMYPPRFSLGWGANVLFLLFAGCAAMAFLPAACFINPSWRAILTNDFGISLPSTVSPQPWLSATCLVSLIAGLAWLYFVSTTNLELRGVRTQLRFFVTGMVMIA